MNGKFFYYERTSQSSQKHMGSYPCISAPGWPSTYLYQSAFSLMIALSLVGALIIAFADEPCCQQLDE
jgi:hypothetical protein